MNESIAMKIISALLVTGVAWTMGSVSTLKANDSAQEVHIQNGIETDRLIQSKQGEYGERITRMESGMGAKLDSLIKKVDGISSKLENMDGR